MQNGKIIANIIAYSLGFGFCAMILLFGLHEAFNGYLLKNGKEPLAFLLLFLVGLVGMFLSFNRKVIGSVFLILSGLGINFYLLFINDFNDIRSTFLLSLPFLIAGVLILVGKEFKK